MNASQQARQAYGGAGSPLRCARQAEYQVLSHVTARLSEADATGDFPALAHALHDNGRLWVRFAADVAGAGNPLPADLRARLFYLAEFTRAQSARVLRGEAGARALIDVNAAVMRGLAGPAPAPGPAAPSPLATVSS